MFKSASETMPAALLRRIQTLFKELGIFGEPVTLSYRGVEYRALCDAESFSVYRLVAHCHIPPGAPGWPVCLVTAETSIDESSPPQLADDEFASGLTIAEWLELIERTCR
jgi:hypothetical protein